MAWFAAVLIPTTFRTSAALTAPSYVLLLVLSGLGIYFVATFAIDVLDRRARGGGWRSSRRAAVALYGPLAMWGGGVMGLFVATLLHAPGVDPRALGPRLARP